MPPTLYMTEVSPSCRAVLITAKAIGIEIRKHYVDLTTGEHLTPEFVKLNPQKTIPVLVEEDGKVLWDGHAIISYLSNKYGKDNSFYPDDPFTRAIIHQRFHFDAEYLFPPMKQITKDIFSGITTIHPSLLNKIIEACEMLEKCLDGHLWAVGNQPTLADFSMIPTVTSIDILCPIDSRVFPNISSWMKKVQSLPCYQENIPGLKIARKILEKLVK